jgi:hypothetical protein
VSIRPSKLARAVVVPKVQSIEFRDGVDIVTPPNDRVPGTVTDNSLNYEININGGYTGIEGYERFDGQQAPSTAPFVVLEVTISGSIVVGDTLVGATSGVSGYVTVVNTTYDPNQTHIVICKLTGGTEYSSGENLEVSAVVEGVADANSIASTAPTPELYSIYKNEVADVYRIDILIVPGEDSILGVWMFKDIVYAFRNAVGGASADMWKSSGAGWVQVPLGFELAFTGGGTTIPEVGDTITGLTSGATATLTAITLETGSWGAGTAEGRFIFLSDTGTFVAENIEINSSTTDDATIAADSVAITLLPDGRYEFDTSIFGGLAGSDKMYGVDKVNRGFEFDGATFVPIVTQVPADQPTHLVVYRQHLFYAFSGSVMHSAIGDPYNWSAIGGATEIAVGDTIEAFQIQPGAQSGSSLAIIARNRVHILYGTSDNDWDLVQYRREIGAYPYSVQELGTTLMMDDRGVVELKAAQEYGNFLSAVVSRMIQPFVNTRKNTVTCSMICREKSQYRLFFGDDFALYFTMAADQVLGVMIQRLDIAFNVACSIEGGDGEEKMYFGTRDTGYVYQLDKGTSFDGDPIERNLTFNFYSGGQPRIEKTYFDISFELEGIAYSEFNFRYMLGYNSADIPQPPGHIVDIAFNPSYWDTMIWDNFIWDGLSLQPSNIGLNGSAENIALIMQSSSDYFEPLTFSGAVIRVATRRQLRS